MALQELDYVLVPAGLLVLLAYHGWFVYAIRYKPRRTVIGLNAESLHQWVHSLMTGDHQIKELERQLSIDGKRR